jgi:hypothetical protein
MLKGFGVVGVTYLDVQKMYGFDFVTIVICDPIMRTSNASVTV